jgi:RNA-directed DNA polymerase
MPYRPMRVSASPRPWHQARQPLTQLNELEVSMDGAYGSLGLDYDNYLMTLRRQHDYYTDLEFKKRNGQTRFISAPNDFLKPLLEEFYKQHLSDPALFHNSAFAYIRGRSAIQSARKHENANWLIKLDIEDFFHNIDERQIYREFRKRGVNKFPSFVVARFLTREPTGFKGALPSKYRRHRANPASRLFDVETRKLGFLPQGSPASGAVSNLVFFGIDNLMEELANDFDVTYSRYSDDLAFSSTGEFDRASATRLLQGAVRTIRAYGFSVNPTKTRIVPPGARKQLLGVLVGEPGLRLPRSRKKQLDKELWAVETHGFRKHAKHLRAANEFQVLNRIHGTLVWAYEVDAHWAEPRLQILQAAAEKQLGELLPSS